MTTTTTAPEGYPLPMADARPMPSVIALRDALATHRALGTSARHHDPAFCASVNAWTSRVPSDGIYRMRGGSVVAVPCTSHWADWEDDDAIRHHGMRCADVHTARQVSRMLARYPRWAVEALVVSGCPTPVLTEAVEAVLAVSDADGLAFSV